MVNVAKRADVLDLFHPSVAEWFRASFAAPTPPQQQGWPAIARGESTLILAPTGSGKTLTAFLWAINTVMYGSLPKRQRTCLANGVAVVDGPACSTSLRWRSRWTSAEPAVADRGIANRAMARGDTFRMPGVAVRTGDATAERAFPARAGRHPHHDA